MYFSNLCTYSIVRNTVCNVVISLYTTSTKVEPRLISATGFRGDLLRGFDTAVGSFCLLLILALSRQK